MAMTEAEVIAGARVWSRDFRREAVGYQSLVLPNDARAPLEVNDGLPIESFPMLHRSFRTSVDWDRLDIPNCGAALLPFRA